MLGKIWRALETILLVFVIFYVLVALPRIERGAGYWGFWLVNIICAPFVACFADNITRCQFKKTIAYGFTGFIELVFTYGFYLACLGVLCRAFDGPGAGRNAVIWYAPWFMALFWYYLWELIVVSIMGHSWCPPVYLGDGVYW
jgi:hypothetical protein